jgi:probable F420-dependent oxidoreductase
MEKHMAGHLKFGLTSVYSGANSYPDAMARIAQAAERAGFDSVWAGGHPFLSETQSRIPPRLSQPDPIVALTFIAAHTRTIRLGTGIILLPQFHPVILAKQLASLDVLSGGRLIFGIGVGWSEHEYAVLGIPYHERGARSDDYLKAMRILWSEDKPVYHGRFVSFEGVQAYPHPVQQPHPPIVVGGNSPGVYRRAIEQANGWFGYALDVEESARAIAALREAAKRYTRPAELGELELSVAPRVPVDSATAQRFAELGVDRLILIPPPNMDTLGLERFIDMVGDTLVGRV